MPDPYSFRESIPNQESLHGLQQMLPPELRPNLFELLGFHKRKLPIDNSPVDDPYTRPDDYDDAVKKGAKKSPFSDPMMIQKLIELFGSSMFDPNELNPVEQASEDAQRKAQAELEYRLALEEQQRNGGVNRETNTAALKGELDRGQRY